jgi:hypothetical protein
MAAANQTSLHINNPIGLATVVSGAVSTPKAEPRYKTGPVLPPSPDRSKISALVQRILPKKSPNARVTDMYEKALQLLINSGLKSIYNNEEFKIGKYTLKQILTVAIVNLWENKTPATYNLIYNSSKSPCTKGQINHRLDLYRRALLDFEDIYSPMPEDKEQAAVAYSIKEFKKGATAKEIYDNLSSNANFYVKMRDEPDKKSKVIYKWEIVEIIANLLAFGFIDSNRDWFTIDNSENKPVITSILDKTRFAEACDINLVDNENYEEEVKRELSHLTAEDIVLSLDEDVQRMSMEDFIDLSPRAGGTRKYKRNRSIRRNKRVNSRKYRASKN